MKLKKGLLVLVALLGVFTLTGCDKKADDSSASTKTETKKESKDSIVGSYELYEMKSDNETISAKDLEQVGITYTLKVNSDKTALLDMDDDKSNLKYDDKYFYSAEDEDEKVEYKFDGSKLTLIIEGEEMTFEKIK